MKAKLALLAFAGVVVAVPAVWLAAHQPPHRPTEPGAVLTFIVGASLLGMGSSRVDLQACKLEYSIVSPK